MKKLIFLITSAVFIILIAGGFFYWWQNQADVRELNKTLPEGVRVVKSLVGDEYKVVNKIDDYEFKIPAEWQGVEEIYYTPENTQNEYVLDSIELKGKEGGSIITVINRFKISSVDLDFESWIKTNFETFGLIGNFTKEEVEGVEIIKTKEEENLVGMSVYFFKKNSVIYAITNGSEEFIRYIIANGKW